jgi:ribosomal protein L34
VLKVVNIFDYQHLGILFIDFISIIVKCMNTFLKAHNNEKNISTKSTREKKKARISFRMATVGGRKVINARRARGRAKLSA